MRFSTLGRFILLLIFAGAGFYGYLQYMGATHAPLQTVMPKRMDIVEAVYATGEVEPRIWMQVRPQMTVRFTQILVDEGDSVVAGDILARADTAAEEATLAELQARLKRYEKDYERDRKLQKDGFLSKKAFDASTANYRETQAQIKSQNEKIARMSLMAPADGIVLRRDLEPGEVKGTGDDPFWIGRIDDLRITAEVDEEDILKVSVGQKVLIRADALPEKVLQGRVDEVTPKGDPVNKSFRVRIGLPPDNPLLIGMTAEVNIVTGEKKDALVLPLAFVKNKQVQVQGAGLRVVETGLDDGAFVEIVSGLDVGEAVVAQGAGE